MGSVALGVDDRFAESVNRAHWDEIAPVHFRSYGVEGLRSRISRIDSIQRRELYPIKDKSLIHLQCHIGTDTLSLALDGAKVTGIDFSAESISIARQLSTETQIPAQFVEANVLELKEVISTKYDVVYTSKGVLCWISDIRKWAETVAALLKDGGIFYIMEIHPASYMFDDTQLGELRIKYSYFHKKEPTHFDDDHPDYSDRSYIPKNKTYEWMWSLSDIMNALIENGLRIEMFNEHAEAFYPAFPGMARTEDGWWILEKYRGMIPLTFSLLARKVASP
jgi:2-polyprenyl-3-methyl-5-hydroxy-6-metoxy-1,4-benzoquinol methylase